MYAAHTMLRYLRKFERYYPSRKHPSVVSLLRGENGRMLSRPFTLHEHPILYMGTSSGSRPLRVHLRGDEALPESMP